LKIYSSTFHISSKIINEVVGGCSLLIGGAWPSLHRGELIR
jgi:hypothetical protein